MRIGSCVDELHRNAQLIVFGEHHRAFDKGVDAEELRDLGDRQVLRFHLHCGGSGDHQHLLDAPQSRNNDLGHPVGDVIGLRAGGGDVVKGQDEDGPNRLRLGRVVDQPKRGGNDHEHDRDGRSESKIPPRILADVRADRRHQPIAFFRDRLNGRFVIVVRRECNPEFADAVVYGALGDDPAIPQILEKLLGTDDLTGPFGEVDEQLHDLRTQAALLVVASDPVERRLDEPLAHSEGSGNCHLAFVSDFFLLIRILDHSAHRQRAVHEPI